MLDTINQHLDFLQRQREERDQHLATILESVGTQMDSFMSIHGWSRKGKNTMYVKTFNGKPITIEFRVKIQEGLRDGGLPQFIHDKSIPVSRELLQMGYFHWNDQQTPGWSLDVVMDRMERFYDEYTLK